MKPRFRYRAGPPDISRILRDLRLKKDHVNHSKNRYLEPGWELPTANSLQLFAKPVVRAKVRFELIVTPGNRNSRVLFRDLLRRFEENPRVSLFQHANIIVGISNRKRVEIQPSQGKDRFALLVRLSQSVILDHTRLSIDDQRVAEDRRMA